MPVAKSPVDPALKARMRSMVRGAYDFQQLRMASGLRLCANFRVEMGQEAGDREEDLPEKAQELIKELRASYRRLTDGLARNRKLPAQEGFVGDGLITDYASLMLVDQYMEQDRVEREMFQQILQFLPQFPIYNHFLYDIVGIGAAMAGVIISEIDIGRAKYPSSLWKYAGLDTGPDGIGRSKRKEHQIDREYTNAKGDLATRKSITFEPFLKTKLIGVLGPSFLRSSSPYSEIYRNVKHRIQTDPSRVKWTGLATDKNGKAEREAGRNPFNTLWRPKRIHDAAIRYMIKMFLVDLHLVWRKLEGLEQHSTYREGLQDGHPHRTIRDELMSRDSRPSA